MKIVPEKAQIIIKAIKEEFEDISYALDERRKRLWCAAKVRAYNKIHGKGGVTLVHKQGKSISITLDKRNSAQPPYSHCPSPRAYFFVADYVGKWIPG